MIYTIIWYIMRCLGISFNIFMPIGLDLLNLVFIGVLVAVITLVKKQAEEPVDV